MNAMNVLPLQVTLAATLAAVAVALWAGSGGGARAALRRAILAVDRVTTTVASVVACLALAVGVAAGLWQVFSRFATETPSTWSEALVRLSLLWMAYLGVAMALRAGALVSIDVVHRGARALPGARGARGLDQLGLCRDPGRRSLRDDRRDRPVPRPALRRAGGGGMTPTPTGRWRPAPAGRARECAPRTGRPHGPVRPLPARSQAAEGGARRLRADR